MAMAGHLGVPLQSPVTGYSFVFHVEIYLLFVVLIALGPLVRRRRGLMPSASRFGLAEMPG
jgi:BCD family chlorophyll transporter-like MFS transporter